MRRIIAATAVSVVVFSSALAAQASAHNVSVRPRADFIESTFLFRGTKWQPFQTVRWYYDELANGTTNQTGRFAAARSGNFNFRWTSNEAPGVHRLCFSQYDSRRGYRRWYTACARYETFLFDR